MQRLSLRSWLSATLLSAGLTLGGATASQALVQSFVPLGHYAVDGAVAEIISATPDGKTLVYTNAGDKKVGILDLSDPQFPVERGKVDVSQWGEPTSVAVTPNGAYALAVMLDDESEIPNQQPGTLIFINLQTLEVAGEVQLRGIGPDSLAITPDGKKAIIAIEDEEDEDGLPGDRSGSINFVTISYSNPAQSVVNNITLDATGIPGVNYATDLQPEFVTITSDSRMVAVSLQENNAIALLDVAAERVIRIFSAGTSVHDRADLTEDDDIIFNEPTFAGRREPDSIAFTSQGHIVTANEGDTDLERFGDGIWSGGRGWSILDINGQVIYDSNDDLEALAILHGQYPDGRSENRGIEVEGLAVATFGTQEFAFVASERGSFIAVYEISNPYNPELVSFLPTGIAPEGILAIPGRNLLLSANEDDGSIDIFLASDQNRDGYSFFEPLVQSESVDVPFAALSGLAARSSTRLYAIPDSAVAPSRIYELSSRGARMLVNSAVIITKDGEPMSYDLEGIAIAPGGDFWLVSEGDDREGRERPNLLIRANAEGEVQEEIVLPASAAGDITRFGFEGVTTNANGSVVYVAIQRAFEGETDTRIAAYDVASGAWEFYFYPLDTDNVDGWVGLSEISRDVDGTYVILERDNQGGENGASNVRVKRVYRVDLENAEPGEVLEKELVIDLVTEYEWFHEKVEGLAVTRGGYWIVTDNDGGLHNSRMIFAPRP